MPTSVLEDSFPLNKVSTIRSDVALALRVCMPTLLFTRICKGIRNQTCNSHNDMTATYKKQRAMATHCWALIPSKEPDENTQYNKTHGIDSDDGIRHHG